jgi:hypothetical protein
MLAMPGIRIEVEWKLPLARWQFADSVSPEMAISLQVFWKVLALLQTVELEARCGKLG